MALEWNESFSVSNKDLDNEHKNLFAMFDAFQNEVKLNQDNKAAIQKIISGLKKYSLEHFKHEEKYMKSINYPYIDVHKTKHLQFIEKIKEFDLQYKTGANIKPKEILTVLKEWLIRHVYVEDKLYANFKALK